MCPSRYKGEVVERNMFAVGFSEFFTFDYWHQAITPIVRELRDYLLVSFLFSLTCFLLQNKNLGQMYWLTRYQIIVWLVEAILSMVE